MHTVRVCLFCFEFSLGGEGALAPRPKENSKQKRQTRTAPHCDRGSLRMANQVATGAGNAFAYGTGAGGSLRMANQVSPRRARLRKQMLQRSAAPRPKESSKQKKET